MIHYILYPKVKKSPITQTVSWIERERRRQDHTYGPDSTFNGPTSSLAISPHLSLTHACPGVTKKQKHGMLYIPEEVLSRSVISADFLFISEGTN